MFLGTDALAVPIAYVAEFIDGGEGKVIKFNLDTGESEVFAVLPSSGDPMGARPRGVAVDDAGRVYVGLRGGTKNVVRYAQDGAFLGDFTQSIGGFGTGLIEFNQNDNLIVAGDISENYSVFRYNGTTGELIDTFNNPTITHVVGITVHEDTVFAAGIFSANIVQYELSSSPVSGSLFITNAVNPATGYKLIGMTIGHTGNLFAASGGAGVIKEFDIDTGALLDTFLVTNNLTADFKYNPTTNKYYRSSNDSLYVYDTNGQLVSTFTNPALTGAYGIAFADIASVPEPVTIVLLTFGLAGLGFARKKLPS